MHEGDWTGYLDQFHASRPGVTEAVLAHSSDDGTDPYAWLAGAVPEADGVCLDLACGSGPLQPLTEPRWVGVDLAAEELALARARQGDAALVRADAGALPIRPDGATSAVCAMALMVIPDVESALRELARVVRQGSTVAFLLPAKCPLTPRDRFRYARLLAAFRRTSFSYPRPDVLARPERFLKRAGFTVVSAERRTFAYPIDDIPAAERLVHSLYLPHTSQARVEAARRVARRWVGSQIGIALRRVVVHRDNDSRTS